MTPDRPLRALKLPDPVDEHAPAFQAHRIDGPASYTCIRLYDGGERVGDVYVVLLGEQMVVGQVNVYRTPTTGDWAEHVRRVDLQLLAEVVALADKVGTSIALMLPVRAEAVRALPRAGFEAAGAVWWRPVRGVASEPIGDDR